jgi:hypothetical protein
MQGTQKSNSLKTHDLTKKWAVELNRALSKEEVQIAKKKNMKKMLNIPGHKGNKSKPH